MGGDNSTAQERRESIPAPGLPYEQMWLRLRESLHTVDETLLRFVAADLRTPDKIAAQVHSAEHFSVTGILGYMDYIEAQAGAGITRPADQRKI